MPLHSLRSAVPLLLTGLLLSGTTLIEAAAPEEKPASRERQPKADAPSKEDENAARKAERAKRKQEEAGPAIRENKATPPERIVPLKGFQVDLIYSVPAETEGSWVNLCLDGKGRMIASDQYGGLYRFEIPAPGQSLSASAIQKVPADIRAANGLLWFQDALYVMVNDYEDGSGNGLYRVTDSDGDDQLDKVELLHLLEARNDHGCHAILPTPDGKALYVVCGNGTKPTNFNSSRVPTIWGEDHLLPRMPDGRGFMREVMGPGGIIYKVSLDGQDWQVVSSGYRNIFDAALNRDGELFTYDADMEYDFNTSWYRPTRVCHAVSGSEFGWRNGAGKRFEWYPDNLPPVVNIGPGSPTGVTFGYGAKFPAKYQEALYVLDWSWGKIYAIHLQPSGASYAATTEEFITGMPLPVTDAIINPTDGAMYFAIGGRKVQSGLYRVTYTGAESTAPAKPAKLASPLFDLRHKLEQYHEGPNPEAVAFAWQHLGHEDRHIRWAARTAIEHNPFPEWADRALTEKDPQARLEALLALVRAGGICPFHREPEDPPVNTDLRDSVLHSLAELKWDSLTDPQRICLVRTYEILLNRFGIPDDAAVAKIVAQLDPHFPAPSFELNTVLIETLAFLQGPNTAAKGIALIQAAPTQEEQIEYARSLRKLTRGWTNELHTAYFEWLLKATNYEGGASFSQFLQFIRDDAVASLSEQERTDLAEVLERKPVNQTPLEAIGAKLAGRAVVKKWKVDDLAPAAMKGLANRNFERGREMFATVGCSICHRFNNKGGMTGPDLTSAGRRYSPRDLIEQIVDPSKVLNEQFLPVKVLTTNGQMYTGVIVNLNRDSIQVNTDLTKPNSRVGIDRKEIELIELSKVSPMPEGLIDRLEEDEILDLLAYVLSGGDGKSPMFAGGPRK